MTFDRCPPHSVTFDLLLVIIVVVVVVVVFSVILLHEKFPQFSYWLRAVVFQLNLKYLHVKITNLLRVVV